MYTAWAAVLYQIYEYKRKKKAQKIEEKIYTDQENFVYVDTTPH